jgi:hypothetical protein
MKQQANIKFGLNLGKQPQKHTKCSKLFTEILYLVHMTDWFTRFREKCEDVEDDSRSDQPSAAWNL